MDKPADWLGANASLEQSLVERTEFFAEKFPDSDPRWLAIARTHFEEGIMALNRAIMKPRK